MGIQNIVTMFIMAITFLKLVHHLDSLAQDCSNSIANALELLQSCTEPSSIHHTYQSKVAGCWNTHYGDVIMTTIASQITSLTIVYPSFYWGADQSKHQSSTSLAFVWGIHRGPVNSLHKGPVTRKMFPFDDVSCKSFTTPFHARADFYWCFLHRISNSVSISFCSHPNFN